MHVSFQRGKVGKVYGRLGEIQLRKDICPNGLPYDVNVPWLSVFFFFWGDGKLLI